MQVRMLCHLLAAHNAMVDVVVCLVKASFFVSSAVYSMSCSVAFVINPTHPKYKSPEQDEMQTSSKSHNLSLRWYDANDSHVRDRCGICTLSPRSGSGCRGHSRRRGCIFAAWVHFVILCGETHNY